MSSETSTSKPGSRLQMVMPWASYCFKITSHAESVASNVVNLAIDFKAKTIDVNVRATVDPQHFLDALLFADRAFRIDAMDVTKSDPYFSLLPKNVRLVSHDFSLDYSDSGYATHRYKFSFEEMGVQAPEEKLKTVPIPMDDDGFMTPDEALKSMADREAARRGLTGGRQLLNEEEKISRDAGC